MAFNPDKFIEAQIKAAREKIGDKPALLALSGGVDSSVAAIIVHKAVGSQLHCVFVDTGMMREGEAGMIKGAFEPLGLRVEVVDASSRFLSALKGVEEPEKKRKIIGEQFIRVFEEYAKKHKIKVLVQCTIAPDWIESCGAGRDTIKSHHNVGGLPKDLGLELFEPLRDCYKHEVRILAEALGLPPAIS
ncbi:GMP synthase [glutamine-hydrolyzing] subunit B [uncultured archaeon]|nr:GMP synthase [glutamine-hydrolyzing] subunit B [uncultured archaeon]